MERLLKEEQYFSIAQPVDAEINIKRSRFIASLRVISRRLEFEEALKEINARYPKANHYCWAYRIIGNPVQEHSSDSGEPSGSAGRPILGTLKKNSLLNIMAVVTRYFGGVKLGVSGLISAYAQVTSQAVINAEIIVQEQMASFEFICSYEMYNLILDALKRRHVPSEKIKTIFEENIFGEFNIRLNEVKALVKDFENMKYRGYLSYRRK